MKIPQNLEELIEIIFQQIEIGIEYIQNGNAPCINNQVMNISYTLIVQVRVFKDTYKE